MRKSLFVTLIFAVSFLSACGQIAGNKAQGLQEADFYAAKGEEYIEIAIDLYKTWIEQEKDSYVRDGLKFKLGSLYSNIGRYAQAIDCFKKLSSQESKKKLAVAYFKNYQQADALAQFDKLGKLKDDEYLYYYGQASEKNNLYDRALDIYSLIPEGTINYHKAKERIKAISLSEGTLSAEHIKNILENSPTQQDYPQAGAVVLLVEEEYEVFSDNTSQFDIHFMAKVFNERGEKQFSEIEIGYDSTFENIELEYARTIKPDGTVVYVGEKNIRDVSVYLNYPLYSNARVRIISMPEVAEGVIVEYRAKKFRKQLVNEKDFMLNYRLQENEPIKLAKFSVKIPKERDFNYTVINAQYNTFLAKLEPEVTVEADKKIYSWRMEDISEILPEPDMPPRSRINPVIMMTSFNTWDDIHSWWYDLYQDKIKMDEDIQDKVNQIVKGKETQEQKLRALYNFCAQDIRYIAVEYGQAGYEPHYATDVFRNKYGDCKDQAILLISMLRSINIKAYPVLIGTYDYLGLNQDFPTIAFNHCIVVVDFQGEWIFMDPTGQTVPFRDLPSMDQDRLVFVILDDGYKIMPTPLFEAQHNSSQIKVNIKINRDGTISAKRSVHTNGVFLQGQRYWLKFTKPKLVEEALRSTANRIAPGARLVNYRIQNKDDLDKNIILEYEFEAPEFLTKAGRLRLLPQLGKLDIKAVAREERRYPIEYSFLKESLSEVEIELPENFTINYLPQDINVDSEWFEFHNSYTKKDGVISFYERYRSKKKNISAQEYKEYKSLLEEISRKTKQKIILEEK